MDEATKQQEIERLLQLRQIRVIENPTASAFVCVYSSEDVKNGFHTFCFLLPLIGDERFLKELSWDYRASDFNPQVQCVEHWRTGEKVREISYLPDGNETGAQPLVHARHFWGLRSPTIEIAEEFRLFHNLYQDTARGVFLHSDIHGVEHEVVRVANGRVEVHLRFLVDFLRAKQMHLAMQWDGAYWCQYSLSELGLKSVGSERRGATFHWHLSANEDRHHDDQCKCISRVIGKALILCPGPVEYRDPYEEDHSAYPSFIVGYNKQGAAITQTSDPKAADKDARHALQPVFFRRGVLARYFAEPTKFSVEDGYLRCGGLWGLRIDNDHPKYVIVFLKDLGLDLPGVERLHWRSFNVAPDGGVSKTFYSRNIKAWFANPTMPDLKLKHLYPMVNNLWQKAYGWPLWREPEEEDRYVFAQVHVCLDESQSEFDQQNGLLAKLLNDSLNEDKIKGTLRAQAPNPGGLNRLQQFFIEAGYGDADLRIRPLRVLQELRSKGSAHRKSSEYEVVLKRAGLKGLPVVDASMKIFAGAVEFIEWLKVNVLKDNS
ncbi:MAG: hypothetical protein HY298_08030 [Verrucomicrobia bacterium]|nr:hypothetical protein [Verrucomicrobiota bacterium]